MSVRERQREMGGGKEREEKREARRGSKCKVYPLTDLLTDLFSWSINQEADLYQILICNICVEPSRAQSTSTPTNTHTTIKAGTYYGFHPAHIDNETLRAQVGCLRLHNVEVKTRAVCF